MSKLTKCCHHLENRKQIKNYPASQSSGDLCKPSNEELLPFLLPQLPRLAENIAGDRRNTTQVVGAYVQEVIRAAVSAELAEAHHLFGGLPVGVEGLVAPRVVEGSGGLEEEIGLSVLGHFVVACRGIVAIAVADAGVHEAGGLVGLDHAVELVGLGGADGLGGVEPDEAEVAVARQDLLDLGLDLLLKATGVVLLFGVGIIPVVDPVGFVNTPGLTRQVAAAVGVRPIKVLGVVETELQVMLVAGLG